MYELLNITCFAFHSGLILFIVFGWIWRKTRWIHLFAAVLTAFSWFGAGLFYGLGYCPFTEWHWRVRVHLGHVDMPRSYIKFLVDQLTGLNVPAFWVDAVTLAAFFIAAALSIGLTVRDWRRSKAEAQAESR